MMKLASLLLLCALASPLQALELGMGGSFYVCVLEGDCPQPIDLWGVGPGRNPLFLGHYQGHVTRRPPIFMGAYKSGQELYIWHETNDPGTGERRSQDIKSPDAYKVAVDPRGGYAIELKAGLTQTEPALKIWVYPGKAPISLTAGAQLDKPAANTLGSVAVNQGSLANGPQQQTFAPQQPPAHPDDPKGAQGWSLQWPLLQLAVATLLFVSYRRSRQMALMAGEVAGMHDLEDAAPVQSFRAPAREKAVAPVKLPPPPPPVKAETEGAPGWQDRPAANPLNSNDPEATVKAAPVPEEIQHAPRVEAKGEVAAPVAETGEAPAPVVAAAPATAPAKAAAPVKAAAPAKPAKAAKPAANPFAPLKPMRPVRPPTAAATQAHFQARAPEGWSPMAADSTSAAPASGPTSPITRPVPAHDVAHAPAESESLLMSLGTRRPQGLPLAFISPRVTARVTASATALTVSVQRALSSAFHDLDLLHVDEEMFVFSGLDLAMRRRVSVHALAPALARDPQLAAQFVREAQEFAALTHKAFLRIHRVVAEPVPHMVCEPLPGPMLCGTMTGEPMPLHEVLATGAPLADALDQLHQRGMIHGDVRPARIAGGPSGELKLCPPVFPRMAVDAIAALGLACPERRAYRAPEVAAGGTADYRGDIHALGRLMHHMLVGAPPDDAKPVTHRASVPEPFATLMARCLQADPGRRYQDCGIPRQMLEAMLREHGARENVVLACLPALARAVRITLKPVAALLSTVRQKSAEQLARDVVNPQWRDTIKTRILGPDGGLAAIGAVIERGHALRRWAQESSLMEMMQKLGRMAVELAGLATLIESGGPRHPSVADRARTELARLGDDIEAFDAAVQAEVTARLVELAGVVKDAAASSPLEVEIKGVPVALRGLFAEPASVRGQLVGAVASVLHACQKSGAKTVSIGGAYEDGFRRLVLTVMDDGRGIPTAVVRPPLAIMPRLTRPAPSTGDAVQRDLDATYDALERLGGRVMLTNRAGTRGVEMRIDLPSHLA